MLYSGEGVNGHTVTASSGHLCTSKAPVLTQNGGPVGAFPKALLGKMMEAEWGIYCTWCNSVRIINCSSGEQEEENPTTFSKRAVTKPLRHAPECPHVCLKLLWPAVFFLCSVLPPFPCYSLMRCKNPLGVQQVQHLFLDVIGGKG